LSAYPADENIEKETYSSFNTYPDLHTAPLLLGKPKSDNHGSDQYSRADSCTMSDTMIGAYLLITRIDFAALISPWVAPKFSPKPRKVDMLESIEPQVEFKVRTSCHITGLGKTLSPL
jgi:hypothetical protein